MPTANIVKPSVLMTPITKPNQIQSHNISQADNIPKAMVGNLRYNMIHSQMNGSPDIQSNEDIEFDQNRLLDSSNYLDQSKRENSQSRANTAQCKLPVGPRNQNHFVSQEQQMNGAFGFD